MSPRLPQNTGSVPRFPRVSGDEPLQYPHPQRQKLFSPRERG